MDIRKELISKFGDNYNSLNNLMEYLNGKYHPKYFKTMQEFCAYANFPNISIEDYTDDVITENENYIIILFEDYRDFKYANKNDNFKDDIVVCFDENTHKIKKYYYTGLTNEYLCDIDAFVD